MAFHTARYSSQFGTSIASECDHPSHVSPKLWANLLGGAHISINWTRANSELQQYLNPLPKIPLFDSLLTAADSQMAVLPSSLYPFLLTRHLLSLPVKNQDGDYFWEEGGLCQFTVLRSAAGIGTHFASGGLWVANLFSIS